MRISQEADYGMRVVLFLSKIGYGNIAGAKIIAEQETISLRFLLKLLRKLTHKGIVRSFRGANGGYALAKPPADISLKDVVEAIDGAVYVNRCLRDLEFCNKPGSTGCEVHRALCRINQRLLQELEDVDFASLLK